MDRPPPVPELGRTLSGSVAWVKTWGICGIIITRGGGGDAAALDRPSCSGDRSFPLNNNTCEVTATIHITDALLFVVLLGDRSRTHHNSTSFDSNCSNIPS